MTSRNVENQYRYFLYSREQLETKIEISRKLGRAYAPKYVLVNGQWLEYTEIRTNLTSGFSDSIVITSGNINEMTYR